MGFRTGLRRRQGSTEGRQRSEISAFAIVGAIVLVTALAGIVTRQAGFLAAFWPASAVLIGLFVRAPSLAGPAGWLGALVGFVVADLITGSSVDRMLALTFGNLTEVVAGFLALRAMSVEHQRLQQPFSILYVFLACIAGGLGAAVGGIWPGVVFFEMSPGEAALTWFASALASCMAILPLVLAAPSMRRTADAWSFVKEETRRTALPLAFLAVSLVAGLLVGGPAAVTFPVPPLLYCALVAGLFPTTVLNLISTAWMMVAITSTDFLLLGELPTDRTILSIQIGLSLLAMGPIAVAANVASRDEALLHLRRTAARDSLTDTLSRGAFEIEAGRLLTRLAAERRPVSLLMLDLDHFKQVNDTYGHQAGDLVLTEFADSVRRCLRDSDLIGRIGGEEFAVVLPGVRREMADILAERIRSEVSANRTEYAGNHFQVTVSVGNAHFESAPAELYAALAAADDALYLAKHRGRNRVVTRSRLGDEPVGPPPEGQVSFVWR